MYYKDDYKKKKLPLKKGWRTFRDSLVYIMYVQA